MYQRLGYLVESYARNFATVYPKHGTSLLLRFPTVSRCVGGFFVFSVGVFNLIDDSPPHKEQRNLVSPLNSDCSRSTRDGSLLWETSLVLRDVRVWPPFGSRPPKMAQ